MLGMLYYLVYDISHLWRPVGWSQSTLFSNETLPTNGVEGRNTETNKWQWINGGQKEPSQKGIAHFGSSFFLLPKRCLLTHSQMILCKALRDHRTPKIFFWPLGAGPTSQGTGALCCSGQSLSRRGWLRDCASEGVFRERVGSWWLVGRSKKP